MCKQIFINSFLKRRKNKSNERSFLDSSAAVDDEEESEEEEEDSDSEASDLEGLINDDSDEYFDEHCYSKQLVRFCW